MKIKDGYVLLVIIVLAMMVGFLGSKALTTVGGVPTYTVPSQCGQFNLGLGSAPYSSTGAGQYPVEPGSPYNYGEIFDTSFAWISWAPGGLSQAITVAGAVSTIANCSPGNGQNHWDAVQYQFSINTGNGAFVPFLNPAIPAGVIQINGDWLISCGVPVTQCSGGGLVSARTFQIRGVTFNATVSGAYDIQDGSVLRVALAFHQLGNSATSWYGPTAYDQVVLARATPSVAFDQGLYPTGGVARLTWHVPVVKIGQAAAYSLTIVYDNDKSYVSESGVVYNQAPIPQNDGVVTFTIPLNTFSSSLSSPNTVSAHIYSRIFLAWRDISFIVGGSSSGPGPGDTSLAPILNSVTFNKPSLQYLQGDTVTITISASPNPTTKLPIVKYYADCYIAGVEQTKTSANNTLSFVAGSSGLMNCVLNAYDSANRPAVPQKVTFVVGNPVGLCELFPTNPQCTPNNGGSFSVPAGYITIMIGMLFAGLVALVVGLYGIENPLSKIPVTAIGVALTLGGIVLFVGLVINWVTFLLNNALAFPWPFK